MNNFISAIMHSKFNPFVGHAHRLQPVPLDGTDSARLTNMLLSKEKFADNTESALVRELWFNHLHSDRFVAECGTAERSLASWFIKGYNYCRPAWGTLGDDEIRPRIETVGRMAAKANMRGYHLKAESVLEVIDSHWERGGQYMKKVTLDPSGYWHSRWNEGFETHNLNTSAPIPDAVRPSSD